MADHASELFLGTTVLFVSIVAVVAILFVLAFGSHQTRPWWRRPQTWALCLWLLAGGALGASGLVGRFETGLPSLPLVLAGSSLATACLVFSPWGARLLHLVPWVVGLQAFRVPVEIVLYLLHLDGRIPVQMTFEGYNFDVLSGLFALGLFLKYRTGPMPKAALWLWNLVGLALLVNIVTIAVLSAPLPIRMFHNEPANTLVAFFPYIWLPTFLVQAAFGGHLLVFRYLLGRHPS
ncbi:hypothetical protein SCOR_27625 [Sulfidibacter corallicola]|uniref:Uncharacterized protein n=1 Tax=Sulfidibacter corallicola TaxID=2818388 RepID=A0A8A4TM94_SULCO|nr:hypothetical protein [Sulfidibacter corallicola]QTD50673.1 hypothetical protein J3U87_34235 [Sulfidibacter corallicola]